MKKIAKILTMLAVLTSIIGCARGNSKSYVGIDQEAMAYAGRSAITTSAYDGNYEINNMYGEPVAEYEISTNSTTLNIERKLIKRANVRIRADNLEKANLSVNELMINYNGFIYS